MLIRTVLIVLLMNWVPANKFYIATLIIIITLYAMMFCINKSKEWPLIHSLCSYKPQHCLYSAQDTVSFANKHPFLFQVGQLWIFIDVFKVHWEMLDHSLPHLFILGGSWNCCFTSSKESKKYRVAAAQSITISWLVQEGDQRALSLKEAWNDQWFQLYWILIFQRVSTLDAWLY